MSPITGNLDSCPDNLLTILARFGLNVFLNIYLDLASWSNFYSE